jgi:hypothetical protein
MKNLTLFLLAFIAFTSCAPENSDPSLVGTWRLVIPNNEMNVNYINETVFYEADSFSNRLFTPDTTYFNVTGSYTYVKDSSKISLSADNFSVESSILKLTKDTLVIESQPNKRVSTFTRFKGED